ncbi:MAG: type IV pilus biogenesis/stability protein PilW [Steroidobacteraceae bacterium]
MSVESNRARGRAGVLAGALAAAVVGGVVAALAACSSRPHVVLPPADAVNVKPQPKLAAEYNVQLGIAYMQRGDLAFAQRKLLLARKENPRSPTVHGTLALLYERLGDIKSADREFHEALRLAPRDPDISNNYAVYLCRTNRIDQGVERLVATARDPLYNTPAAAYTNAAVCLSTVHRDAEAKSYLGLAIKLQPGFEEAVFQLANLELRGGDLADARAAVDHYIHSYTETPELLALGARIAHAQRDPVGEQHYKERLRVDFPNSPQTRALVSSDPNPG